MLVDLVWMREEVLNRRLQDVINTDRVVDAIQVAIFIKNEQH